MTKITDSLDSKYRMERLVTYLVITIMLLSLLAFVIIQLNNIKSDNTNNANTIKDDGTYKYEGKLFSASLPCRASQIENTLITNIDYISCFTEASGFWITSDKDFDDSEYTSIPVAGEDEDGTIISNVSRSETTVGDYKGLTTIWNSDERNYETGGRAESKIIQTRYIANDILYTVTMMTAADSANEGALEVYGRVIDSMETKNDK